MKIEFASAADAEDLLKIYAQYINTPITFEYTLPTVEEFAGRIENISRFYPYLICRDGGRAVGYAYANRHKERAAYGWNAELSVYIDKDYTSRRLGTKMYNILIDILRLQGVKTVYGGVTLPNKKSEKLHLSLGFQLVATYNNTGYKCGKWHDVTWYEKEISPHINCPAPVISIKDLSIETLMSIIQNKINWPVPNISNI